MYDRALHPRTQKYREHNLHNFILTFPSICNRFKSSRLRENVSLRQVTNYRLCFMILFRKNEIFDSTMYINHNWRMPSTRCGRVCIVRKGQIIHVRIVMTIIPSLRRSSRCTFPTYSKVYSPPCNPDRQMSFHLLGSSNNYCTFMSH